MTRASLDYPFATPPESSRVLEVAPGIRWIRMPLPFALDHINLWALDDGDDGVALVDSGLGNDETKALWEELLAGPLAGRRPTRLIATHFHPDHMGLSGWLCQRLGIELTASQREWLFGRMLWLEDSEEFTANQVSYYRRIGFDAEQLEGVRARGNTYRARIDVIPVRVVGIRHGDDIVIGGRSWRMIEGGGHSPEHACLYCAEANVLISGDQILPRISPIVGVWPQQPEAEPLSLFLDALDRLRELPADTLVLPSHGLPFRGLHTRVDELKAHHGERLDKTLSACAEPVTAGQVLRVLFKRELDAHQMGFATGETLAHLHHLMRHGQVLREEGRDGVWRYRRA
ncbi:MBL fold metallo-hydrolase [Paramagnetospirillum kuznetsovii]|uniref:MBL fold metallo-hydrolase n=1 Tax=Paramagnetospirillum kuznetsovii TaxID=2053833 RepID=A0A364NWS0_9PROT|nr:MBL fold metallo-hydrolase [Paramagnetospirillum kuznetsovii]RAU21512.1 MBL fold metallo-hydrolase [Paramagnetospirillum kuznetsovii]